jgi:hypothetical protein
MIERERISGWMIWEDEQNPGMFYVRLEAVAAHCARSTPNTADALLQWLLSQGES